MASFVQVIEQLMRQIMHYDTEFRREEATSAVGSSAKHRPRFGSSGASDQFDPTPTMDRPGGHWACLNQSRASRRLRCS